MKSAFGENPLWLRQGMIALVAEATGFVMVGMREGNVRSARFVVHPLVNIELIVKRDSLIVISVEVYDEDRRRSDVEED